MEWAPPPDLDTGQARVNFYHRPEKLLRPSDPFEPDRGNRITPQPPPGNDGRGDRIAPQPPPGDDGCGDQEASMPSTNDDAAEPGGPAPPDDEAA